MKKTRLALLALCALLAACDGDADATVEVGADSAASAAALAPAPAAPAAPSMESYASEASNVTFQIPTGWEVEPSEGTDGVDRLVATSPDGQVVMQVVSAATGRATHAGLLRRAMRETGVREWSSMRNETVNGLTARIAESEKDLNGTATAIVMMAAVDGQGHGTVAWLATPADRLAENRPTIERILDSFAPVKR